MQKVIIRKPVLWTRLGFGAKPRFTYNNNRNSVADFAVEWCRWQRGTGGFPVPRCRLRNGTAKILSVNGLRGGDFAGGFPAKYYLVH